MNEAEASRADLDNGLAEVGEDIRLQRLTTAPGGAQVSFECTCRAVVRGYTPAEIVSGSGIIQQDVKVILSPSDIERAQWPGATPMPEGVDRRVPVRNDRIIRQGRTYAVQAAQGIYVGGELVRIELQVRG